VKIFSTVGDLLRNRFSLRTINKFNSTVKKYKWSCSNVSGLVAVHIMARLVRGGRILFDGRHTC